MATVVVRFDPQLLGNPDADIRYRLPDLLVQRSAGVVSDDAYDSVGDEPLLVLFLKATKLKAAIACVLDVVQNVRVLDNDLGAATVVAVRRKGGYEILYPSGFVGPFLPG